LNEGVSENDHISDDAKETIVAEQEDSFEEMNININHQRFGFHGFNILGSSKLR
jgi:hypothetical protein